MGALKELLTTYPVRSFSAWKALRARIYFWVKSGITYDQLSEDLRRMLAWCLRHEWISMCLLTSFERKYVFEYYDLYRNHLSSQQRCDFVLWNIIRGSVPRHNSRETLVKAVSIIRESMDDIIDGPDGLAELTAAWMCVYCQFYPSVYQNVVKPLLSTIHDEQLGLTWDNVYKPSNVSPMVYQLRGRLIHTLCQQQPPLYANSDDTYPKNELSAIECWPTRH